MVGLDGESIMDSIRITEASGGVVLEFTRSEKRNALNGATSRELSAAFERLRGTPLPVVLRSATPGMFVAGADLNELRQRSVGDSLARLNQRLFQQIQDHPWPTVAVVDGWALGGGFELALACDIRLSTAEAVWGLPEVRLGIVPSGGALSRLEPLIGRSRATELILTGARIDGCRAHEIGLVQRLAARDGLDGALGEVLDAFGQTSMHAVRLAKEAMRVNGDRDRLVDAAAQTLCLNSEDTQQRISSVLDRPQSG